MEFESWAESEEYLKAASSEQLHELALEHLPCWDGEEERCEFDKESLEDGGLDSTIILRVIGAKNVSTKTLIAALDNGSPDGDWASDMSYAVMSSPAITKEVLLKVPAWNHEQAWWIINHELADREVIENLEASGYYVSEIIDRVLWLQQKSELIWYLTQRARADGSDATEEELQEIVDFKLAK
jgi:hypothetical protein